MNNKLFSLICLGLYLGFTFSAEAALVSRLGGLAVYDDDLNLTWLADGNAAADTVFDDGASKADGRMSWENAQSWASNLSVAGISGWRLPTTMVPDSSCGMGASITAGVNGCTGSEMGHLFYDEIGGEIGGNILAIHNDNFDFFPDLSTDSSVYWSGTTYEPNTKEAYRFSFNGGVQFKNNKLFSFHALAVHDGDVSNIPVPAAFWFLISGIVSLAGLGRIKLA